jgi:predicted nucleic acid-binding protein
VTGYFLDTGFLIALEAINDEHHETAQVFWQDFLKHPSALTTSSFVLDEVVTFFNARGQHRKATHTLAGTCSVMKNFPRTSSVYVTRCSAKVSFGDSVFMSGLSYLKVDP